MLDYEKIMDRANELYAHRKYGAAYIAPEIRPTIRSDQVKAMLEALLEALNGQS